MATFPAANHLTDSARTEGEGKADWEAWLAATKQIPGAAQAELAVTIAGGSLTPAGGGGVLAVETESLAATDDLANILTTNYPDGACLLLRNNNTARFVVVKNAATGSGQIHLDRNADYVLDDTEKWLLIQRRGTDWYEIVRGPARLSMPVVAKNANFTISREDCGKVFVCTNSIIVSFAAAATLGNGFSCSIINGNASLTSIALDPNGSETIDGQTSLSLMPFGIGILIVCNGSTFYSVNGPKKSSLVQPSFSSTLTINTRDGDYFEVGTLTGNVTTFNLNDGYSGKRVRIRFQQDATGGRTVALPSGAKVSGSLAATANQVSHLDVIYAFGGVVRWEGAWTQIPL